MRSDWIFAKGWRAAGMLLAAMLAVALPVAAQDSPTTPADGADAAEEDPWIARVAATADATGDSEQAVLTWEAALRLPDPPEGLHAEVQAATSAWLTASINGDRQLAEIVFGYIAQLHIIAAQRANDNAAIVAMQERLERYLAGETLVWMRQQAGHAAVALDDVERAERIIERLQATEGPTRVVTGAQRAAVSIQRALQFRPGHRPPAVDLPSLAGDGPIALVPPADAAEGAPRVLVVAWASWNPFARSLLTEWLPRWIEAGGDRLTIRLVSADDAASQRAYRAALGLLPESGWLIDAEGSFAESWMIGPLPYLVLMDPDGTIAASGYGDAAARIGSLLGWESDAASEEPADTDGE